MQNALDKAKIILIELEEMRLSQLPLDIINEQLRTENDALREILQIHADIDEQVLGIHKADAPAPDVAENDDQTISEMLSSMIDNAHRVYKSQGRLPFGHLETEL